MIAYPRTDTSSESPEPPSVRIIGLGNAGAHLADRLQMNGHPDVVVMNTDAQSLLSSIVAKKVALGQKTTYGLGAGGDPEVGYDAAQESRNDIRSAVEGANIVFLCAGLGGGTASGVIPILAEAARESGAVVFSIVTSPFSFEGRRRSKQAAEALALLSKHSNALIHFENDRMADLSSARSGIEETFAAANSMLCACVGSLIAILRGGSPMPIGLADLLVAVGGGGPAGLFGRGEATGDNRAHEALERALKSPLLDRGRLIGECHAVIANLVGPASLSFSEVAAVMREVRRHTADDAKLFLGVTTVSDSDAPLIVTSETILQSRRRNQRRFRPRTRRRVPFRPQSPLSRRNPYRSQQLRLRQKRVQRSPLPRRLALRKIPTHLRRQLPRRPNRKLSSLNPRRADASIKANRPSSKEKTSTSPLS
jgi:cell division protein FtsZ